MSHSDQLNLSEDFAASASTVKTPEKKKAKTTSISVRVTEEEKAALQVMAGTMALAHFIRERALGDDAKARAKQYQVKPRQPSLDSTELARLLGMFGQSELATAILALSLAATQGNIDITPELEEKIECACDDIQTVKQALILALGVKPQGIDCP